jgi:hypothetical protein
VGNALANATASVGRIYEGVQRIYAAGGILRQAARREEPKADVPRPGWPPGRWQGPGWG